MEATKTFKEVIQKHLEDRAANDPLFAETFKKEGKNIDDCVTYILNTVKNSGCNGFDDAEIFGMAVHYYDEDDIKPGKAISGKVVINRHVDGSGRTEQEKKMVEALHHNLEPNKRKVKLTKAEIAEAKQKAMDDVYQKQLDSLKKKPKKHITEQPVQQTLF